MSRNSAVLALAFAAVAAAVAPLPASWARGVVFFALNKDDFAHRLPSPGGESVFQGIDRAATNFPGLTHIALQFVWRQSNATASDVHATADTPTDAQLAAVVAHAASRNLSVFLKPIVVARTTCK